MLQSKEQIGKMDRKILIQVKILGDNVSNEDPEIGWDIFSNPWARVEEVTGDEAYEGDKLRASERAYFFIRYQSGLLESMRIVHNRRKYNIISIQYLDRKRTIKIVGESGGQYVEGDGPGFTIGYNTGFNA